MSAISAYCDNDKIILQCDGYYASLETGEMLSTSHKKIRTVNDQCAYMNVGAGAEYVNHLLNDPEVKRVSAEASPKDMAANIGIALNVIYTNPQNELHDFMHVFVGYGDNGPELWYLSYFSEEAKKYGFKINEYPFKPVKVDFEQGTSFAIAVGVPPENTSFSEKMEQYQKDNKPFNASHLAFQEMVKEYNEQGMHCGGTIFGQLIRR